MEHFVCVQEYMEGEQLFPQGTRAKPIANKLIMEWSSTVPAGIVVVKLGSGQGACEHAAREMEGWKRLSDMLPLLNLATPSQLLVVSPEARLWAGWRVTLGKGYETRFSVLQVVACSGEKDRLLTSISWARVSQIEILRLMFAGVL